jgi:hypothetical protein
MLYCVFKKNGQNNIPPQMNGKFTRIDVSTDQQLLRGCCDADASPTIFARATLNMNFPGTGGGGSLCLHFTQGVTGLRGVAVFFFCICIS